MKQNILQWRWKYCKNKTEAQPMKSVDANARITYANFARSSVLLLQNTTKKNRQAVKWKIIPI